MVVAMMLEAKSKIYKEERRKGKRVENGKDNGEERQRKKG
jgi:hypothetical protein